MAARIIRSAEEVALFRLAHLSDLHATTVRFTSPRELGAKRALGWLSWQLRRRHKYLPRVADAVLADLAAEEPDHIAVTGDLTHMGLASEIEEARTWLAKLGPPERVTLVPGNHDAYGEPIEHGVIDAWRPYFDSDPGAGTGALFPSVRIRGPVALIGLSSACPTPLHLATGRLGEAQLARLPDLLSDLAARKLCRVLLMHHPPGDAHVSWRRRLEDGAALRAILARVGAELILHGHTHRASREEIAGPRGPIPALGVPATSSASLQHAGTLQLISIAAGREGFEIRCKPRGGWS